MADQAMIRVLNGERLDPPPVWIMRQAGRYLPEYRELRARAKDFLTFCYTPDLAVEAVMQPLRRFDLDAAILFSDILVVPDALGHKVWFVEGEGPRLDPLFKHETWRLGGADKLVERLAPVYETVKRLRAALPAHIPLIGFAGGPWTVSTYMIQGQGGDKDLARLTAYRRPADVDALLALLVEASALHLAAQAAAGAAGKTDHGNGDAQGPKALHQGLGRGDDHPLEQGFRQALRPAFKDLQAIGAGALLGRYARETGVTALGVDTQTPPAFARAEAPAGMPLQGALDPQLLICGGAALEAGARELIEHFRPSPHIFNLGHGITPQTPPENLAALIDIIKRH